METVLDFANAGPTTVTVDWIDYEGRPKNYYTLRSGETCRSGTFVGHVWRATDDTGALLGYYVASEIPALTVVQARAKPAAK